MNFKQNSCLICSSNDLIHKIIGGNQILFCRNCDIHFSAEIPEKQDLENYYQKSYKITEPDFVLTEKRRIARIPEQFNLLGEISQYVKQASKILDIGCDKGFFLDEARRTGFKVSGVEPSEAARNYCNSIGLDMKSHIDEINEKFDGITLWHSLEHTPNPIEYISLVKTKLNSNGYLFIRVPAFDSIPSKFFRSRWIWFQPHNHYFHFSHKSLNFLLKSLDLEVIKIEKRKPNTRLTRKAFFLSQHIFSIAFEKSPKLLDYIKYFYQSITAVELFAVARLKV